MGDEENFSEGYDEAAMAALEAQEKENTILREEVESLKTSVGEIMQVRDQREKRLREENARLLEQINSAYDKGRESRRKAVVAGHALFVYAQKVTHKIKHHSLEKLFPLPDGEILAFIEAVNESSMSERARAAIREGGKG